jgi:5-methylcytosine-specific restriction endonuclease McrA
MAKARVDFRRKARGRRITALLSRDGDRCHLCGEPLDRHVRDERSGDYITFDHVIPASKGGLTVLPNLRLAHQRCNLARGAKPLSEVA